MMKKLRGSILPTLCAGLLFGFASPLWAVNTAPGMAEVRAMGYLNGEALACKHMALVDRIRMRIITEAPKTREVGEEFEMATNERFLAMGSSETPCPDGRTMAERIEAATQAMRAAFTEALGRKPSERAQ
jgi:hypothetical protein